MATLNQGHIFWWQFTEKDIEEGSFCSFACLLLLLLASSSTVELGHSITSVKTYFFRIPTQTEDQLRHTTSWTKQHPDPWPFYWERAIMRLARPQPQATLINPLKIYKCALSGPSQWRSVMHQPSVPQWAGSSPHQGLIIPHFALTCSKPIQPFQSCIPLCCLHTRNRAPEYV